MSKKTEEIKLRVTPEEKHAWQVEAEAQGVSLSKLICERMNQSPVVFYDTDVDKTPKVFTGGGTAAKPTWSGGWNIGVDVIRPIEFTTTFSSPVAPSTRSCDTQEEVQAVPTNDAEKSFGERRTEECECGKPSYIFCSTCRA